MTTSLTCVGLDLRQTVWSLRPSQHGLVEVRGPDAADFLHRLSSQDVLVLPEGGVARAAFLNPKGKLQAAVLVARVGGAFLLEVESAQVSALVELLSRYQFAEKLAIRARADLVCAELIGDRAPEAVGLAPMRCKAREDGGAALAAACRGLVWARVHHVPLDQQPWPPVPAAALAPERAEALRIAAGIVRVGVDTDASTLGPEAMLEHALSATKGCYTGQEIVARLSTYGHLNRRLCVVRVSGSEALPPGTTLVETEDHEPVGRITSSAPLPGQQGSVALAYLPREFWTPGSELRARGADGPPVYVLDFGAAEQSAT